MNKIGSIKITEGNLIDLLEENREFFLVNNYQVDFEVVNFTPQNYLRAIVNSNLQILGFVSDPVFCFGNQSPTCWLYEPTKEKKWNTSVVRADKIYNENEMNLFKSIFRLKEEIEGIEEEIYNLYELEEADRF